MYLYPCDGDDYDDGRLRGKDVPRLERVPRFLKVDHYKLRDPSRRCCIRTRKPFPPLKGDRGLHCRSLHKDESDWILPLQRRLQRLRAL